MILLGNFYASTNTLITFTPHGAYVIYVISAIKFQIKRKLYMLDKEKILKEFNKAIAYYESTFTSERNFELIQELKHIKDLIQTGKFGIKEPKDD